LKSKRSIKVKVHARDSDLLLRAGEIMVSGKNIRIPMRSINVSHLKAEIPHPIKENSINELFTILRPNKVLRMMADEKFARKVNVSISSRIRAYSRQNDINILFVAYDDNYPSERELEFLLDTIFPLSDMVPIPIIRNLNRKLNSPSDFEKLKSYMQRTCEILQSFPIKPLMGYIPITIPYIYIRSLVEIMINIDMNAFFIDFDGRTPFSVIQNVSYFLRQIYNHYGENRFLLAINTNPGRVLKTENVIPAKDFLILHLGIDCLGGVHVPPRGPKSFFEKYPERSTYRYRIFNREDYGYYRLTDIEYCTFYPEDSVIPRKLFKQARSQKLLRDLQEIFNIEQHFLECKKIYSFLTKGEIKILDYLKQKSYVQQKYLDQLLKAQKGISQKELKI